MIDRQFDNIVKRRGDFPLLSQEINGHTLSYLDNGATTQKPAQVIQAMDDYYKQFNANVHRGVHKLSALATERYETCRGVVKKFINAESSKEIIFTSGATDSLNCVAYSFGLSQLSAGDEILISELEHHSNIVPWQLIADKTGAVIKTIPISDTGQINLDAYLQLLSSKTKIVAVCHVSNSLGVVTPLKEIITAAHMHNAFVVVDGTQALPHFQVDVQALNADFYVFSAHKMYGPTGVGVLYGKQALLEKMPPFRGGGEMIETVSITRSSYATLPHKFEAGTPNIAGVIGFTAAIEYLQDLPLAEWQAYENYLANYLIDALKSIDVVTLHGQNPNNAPIVSFTLAGIHPHDIGTILDNSGVAIRVGHHCTMPLMNRLGIPGTARASIALYSNQADIDQLITGINQAVSLFA